MKRPTLLAVATSALAMGVGWLSLASGSAQSSGLPQLTLAMDGTSITAGGALQSGAVDVVSTTTKEPSGGPMLIYLNPGVSPDQVLAELRKPGAGDPNNANHFGAIVFDAEADRGTSHVQTTLQPGQYMAFDTTNHDATKWPHTTFTVAAAAQPTSLPTPQATISAIDLGLKGPSTLHAGELVRFQNSGFLVHMIAGIEARNATAAKKIVALLKAGNDKAVRRQAINGYGFTGPLSSGQGQQMTITAKPGVWVLVCFMDTQDHREHSRLGMVKTIRITR